MQKKHLEAAQEALDQLKPHLQPALLGDGNVAVVLSGGNIDPMLMLKAIQRGLALGLSAPAIAGSRSTYPAQTAPPASSDHRRRPP